MQRRLSFVTRSHVDSLGEWAASNDDEPTPTKQQRCLFNTTHYYYTSAKQRERERESGSGRRSGARAECMARGRVCSTSTTVHTAARWKKQAPRLRWAGGIDREHSVRVCVSAAGPPRRWSIVSLSRLSFIVRAGGAARDRRRVGTQRTPRCVEVRCVSGRGGARSARKHPSFLLRRVLKESNLEIARRYRSACAAKNHTWAETGEREREREREQLRAFVPCVACVPLCIRF